MPLSAPHQLPLVSNSTKAKHQAFFCKIKAGCDVGSSSPIPGCGKGSCDGSVASWALHWPTDSLPSLSVLTTTAVTLIRTISKGQSSVCPRAAQQAGLAQTDWKEPLGPTPALSFTWVFLSISPHCIPSAPLQQPSGGSQAAQRTQEHRSRHRVQDPCRPRDL